MGVQDVIRQRRTVHNYQKSDISLEDLQEGLEAALQAPNHRFTFPWRFTIVGEQTRQKLADLAAALKAARKGERGEPREQKRARDKILNPAALVVFFCRISEDPFTAKEDYASVACAIQNFTLVMTEKGYGSKWSSGKITRDPEMYRLLGVDPQSWESCGFIWVGKQDGKLASRRRPALSDVLTVSP